MPRARIQARCRKRPRKRRKSLTNPVSRAALRRRFFIGQLRRVLCDCAGACRSRYLLHEQRRWRMKIDLSGKTALVTGSTSGIGHAIAKGLAAAGADVVINGRTQGKVDAAVAAIAKAAPGGKIAGVAADVSTAVGCQTLAETLPDVDILVNNAGIYEPKGFFNIPDDDWSS